MESQYHTVSPRNEMNCLNNVGKYCNTYFQSQCFAAKTVSLRRNFGLNEVPTSCTQISVKSSWDWHASAQSSLSPRFAKLRTDFWTMASLAQFALKTLLKTLFRATGSSTGNNKWLFRGRKLKAWLEWSLVSAAWRDLSMHTAPDIIDLSQAS